jgi:hypothetical protein
MQLLLAKGKGVFAQVDAGTIGDVRNDVQVHGKRMPFLDRRTPGAKLRSSLRRRVYIVEPPNHGIASLPQASRSSQMDQSNVPSFFITV